MKKGMIFIYDGADAVGKSTRIKNLKSRLIREYPDNPVQKIHLSWSPVIHENLGDYILSNIEFAIKQAHNGVNTIFDRSHLSTYVYNDLVLDNYDAYDLFCWCEDALANSEIEVHKYIVTNTNKDLWMQRFIDLSEVRNERYNLDVVSQVFDTFENLAYEEDFFESGWQLLKLRMGSNE